MAHGASNAMLEGHLAAAASDQQDLEQVAVTMSADGPVVNRGARRDRLDMNEVKGLIVRRVAVEMKQWEGGGGHAKS
jgi:cytidylate kinase